MNSSGYILARIASTFGIHRKTKRLSEAADEMHLLCQAEEILGEDIWEQVEELDEVHVNYWNLRKYQLAIIKLEKKLNKVNNVLEASQEERNAILNHTNEMCQTLEETRDGLIKQSEQIIVKRDEIILRAQQIKRRFEASRTKVAVLTTQDEDGHDGNNSDAIKEERTKLEGYKQEFTQLKKEREEIGGELSKLEIEIEQVDDKLSADRQRLRDESATAYQNIGQANRDKSKLSAEIGTIAEKKKQHFLEIGRYISTHTGTDPICTKICSEHTHLIAQMQSLRSSIALNHKLAVMAGKN